MNFGIHSDPNFLFYIRFFVVASAGASFFRSVELEIYPLKGVVSRVSVKQIFFPRKFLSWVTSWVRPTRSSKSLGRHFFCFSQFKDQPGPLLLKIQKFLGKVLLAQAQGLSPPPHWIVTSLSPNYAVYSPKNLTQKCRFYLRRGKVNGDKYQEH